MLEMAKGETENIKVAKGKNLFPETFTEALKGFKKELKWQKKYK